VLIDGVKALDEFGEVIATIHDMEDGTNYLRFARNQSSTAITTTEVITTGSYDGLAAHRLVWTYPALDEVHSLGAYHNIGFACGTSPTFPDTTKTIRLRMACRSVVENDVPLPVVLGPIVGNQTTVSVVTDEAATEVQLYVNGEPYGDPVAPTGTETDFTDLPLLPDDSISATQTTPDGESNLAYPRGVAAGPLPPIVTSPLAPDTNLVEVTGLYDAEFATASLTTVYVNGAEQGSAVPTGTTAVVTLDITLETGDIVTATQTVNGGMSIESDPVTVGYPAPVIYSAPAAGVASILVVGISDGIDTVTITVNEADEFSASVPTGADRVSVPVSGLEAGDTLVATQSIGEVQSALSAVETVTVNTSTVAFFDTMEGYETQDDFENEFIGSDPVPADTGWWPSSGDPGLTLSFDNNWTQGGTRSAYCPAGMSPPAEGWGDGWQSNYDFAYRATPLDPVESFADDIICFSVAIYDSQGPSAPDMRQWASLRDYSGGGLGGIIAIGMPGTAFYPSGDPNYYHARVYGGGPGYIELNQFDAPQRSVGWHVFTAVIKPDTVDLYVDNKLARKGIERNNIPYDNMYMGSGYEPSHDAYYDDFSVRTGKVVFPFIPEFPPAPPAVTSPLQAGDTTVTVTDVIEDALLVSVYADDTLIGSVNPAGADTVDVTVDELVHLESITATQTDLVGESEMSNALEVGNGSGDILICIGIRETGDTGDLGTPGSTSGSIEWIGATEALSGAPQGVPISPSAEWQTLVFDPATSPITGFTGNGEIDGTRGTLEHLAVAVDAMSPDRSTGPYLLYVDNVVNVDAGRSDVVIADFEGFDLDSEVLFQEPTYSGSTGGDLSFPPSGSSTVGTGNPGQSQLLTWFWIDTTLERWARITTFGVAEIPNPIIDLTKPIQMDVLLTNDLCGGQQLGDTNCDGAVNSFDIDPFILGLTDFASWDAEFGSGGLGCDAGCVLDCNQDGAVNSFDIDPFILILTGG
jgi:hypothetical protein